MLKKIIHWSGIVFNTTLGFLHKAETKVAEYEPAIEKAMRDGESVAKWIPGPIGTMTEAGLNLAIEALGAMDKTLHYTDAEFVKIKEQVDQAATGSGFQAILVPEQLVSDFREWLANVKPLVSAVKAEAQAITGNAGSSAKQIEPAAPAAPSPASVPPVAAVGQ